MDARTWRSTMGQFATGVTIITTIDEDGQPLGMTANAFTSLSLEPPMALICVDRGSSTLPKLIAAGKYCVNVLGASQQALSGSFARKGGSEKFQGIAYERGELDLPVLQGCLTSIECEISDVLEGGDHLILLGRGIRIHPSEAASQAEPLIFYQGSYAKLEPAGV
ncbi:flavin reductase family protein [Paenibacillus sp. SYP-B4298]|uniref:flavin reductase family protein n=1 Tax=Paenibacillus sp. SYP-B4298 TaxID=2996034 RepID=UPI0022DE0554|nr:flavin reductase family protein [Paenibacillus sp. SYP-B4298]